MSDAEPTGLEALRTAFPRVVWRQVSERKIDGAHEHLVVHLRSSSGWWGGSAGPIHVGYFEAGGPLGAMRALQAECIRLGDWARGCE